MTLPNARKIVVPEGGWKPFTLYLVDVSWRASNPIHRAFLHTGFITPDGSFGGYCEVWINNYDGASHASGAYFLQVVQELLSTK